MTLCSICGFRFRIPTLRPGVSTVDENAVAGNDGQAPQSAIAEFSEGAVRKPHAGGRLDALSRLRIQPIAIKFTSPDPHGSGGMADVTQATYIWQDGSDEQVVAVKQVRHRRDQERKKFENAFAHEVEVMAGLSHQNTVRLIGFVEDFESGTAWIVMSWEPNGNVREFLASGDWEIPERISLIQDIFEGIKYLHTRQPPICHGDLKSLNVLVSASCRAIIIDFGSARAIRESQDEAKEDEDSPHPQGTNPVVEQASPAIHVSAAGNQLTLTGPAWSLRWAAPEVMNGASPGLSSDIWAAGWVCWELMTDKVPFPELETAGGIILKVVRGSVPSPREESGQLGQIMALCSLMTDCWAFNPKSRPNITQCCSRLKWMPSTVPSGSKVPSANILLQQGQMHYEQDNYETASSLFHQALYLARSVGDEDAIGKALDGLGDVYRAQGKYAQAVESHTQAQAIFVRTGDDRGLLNTLVALGLVYRLQSKYIESEEAYTRALEVSARLENDLARANALRGLGHAYRVQQKFVQAEETFSRAEEIYTRIGDDLDRSYTLKALGDVYRRQSKYAQAEESYIRAQESSARVGDDLGQANTLKGLGHLYIEQSKYTEAEGSYTQAQDIYARIGHDLGKANTLQSIGNLCRDQGRNVEAAARWTEARELFSRIGRTEDVEAVSRCLAGVLPDHNSLP